eukprot:TRINITY_DN67444_c0_g1_i1.p1 TRINITY_DN67444_c0_g1~~TRINITY_DN67444_c0_g1_i1.p1  ORF type:complete len:404 (-),score=36.86 TRINITY_DN67444_c0_g1_i1:159-1370(-)
MQTVGVLTLCCMFVWGHGQIYEESLLRAHNAFAEKLIPVLCIRSENCLYSSNSLAYSLAAVMEGIDGFAKIQILQALNITTQEIDNTYQFYQSLTTALSKNGGLQQANAIFVDEEFPLLDNYVQFVQDAFSVYATNVNFQAGEESVNQINQFVLRTTFGSISQFLPLAAITESTKSLLINAVNFQNIWEYQFDVVKQEFFFDAETAKNIDMMYIEHMEIQVGDFKELGLGVARLPYSNSTIEMFVLLPEFYPIENSYGFDAFSIDEMVLRLSSPGSMQSLLDSDYENKSISLYLPRFSLSSALRFGRALEKLGVKEIFIPGSANFSKMTPENGLFITEGFHGAQVKITEHGHQQQSSLDVHEQELTALEDVTFRVDRPFAFMLVDVSTESVITFGVIMDPTKP